MKTAAAREMPGPKTCCCCCCEASDDHTVQITADFPLIINEGVFSLKLGDGLHAAEGKGLEVYVDEQFEFDRDTGALKLAEDLSKRVKTVPPLAVEDNKLALRTTDDLRLENGELKMNYVATNPCAFDSTRGTFSFNYDSDKLKLGGGGNLSVQESYVPPLQASIPIILDDKTLRLNIGDGLTVKNGSLYSGPGEGFSLNGNKLNVESAKSIQVHSNYNQLTIKIDKTMKYDEQRRLTMKIVAPFWVDHTDGALKVQPGPGTIIDDSGINLNLGPGLRISSKGKLELKIRESGKAT